MPENNEIRTPREGAGTAPEETNAGAAAAWPDISGVPTTPVAPPGGEPVWPDNDLAGVPTTPVAPPGGEPVWPGNDLAGVPTTPVAPPGGEPVWPDNDLAGVPTTPVAPPGGEPVWPGNTFPWPGPPVFPFPPSSSYSSQVRFLNASTNGQDLDVWIDGRNIFSGSTFATVSSYIQVSDGFHTVTVRRTNGPALYRRTLSFISGEKVTMVLLDTPGGITLSRVSDMGCTNIPAGYGCLRVANMSYSGSNYDVRTFNNQIVFGGVGFKEVTAFKQTAAGNYTFFVTASQASLTGFAELPVILLTAITGGCSACMVNDPIMSFGINVRPGRVYTSYIIGNPWSNLYRVYTLES